MKRIVIFITLAFLILIAFPESAFADFGIVLKEDFNIEHIDETGITSKTTLFPWVSYPFGDVGGFYLSAGISAAWSNGADYNGDLIFIPELFRLEIYYSGFRIGRIFWQDVSLLAARGYFDGAELLLNAGKGSLGAAVFYTGFLYKDAANINISPGDPADYTADFKWRDFSNTYFAPRRLAASLYGEIPGLPYGRGILNAGLLAQFDFSDAEQAFNTQYLLLRYTFNYKRLDLSLAGALELENTQAFIKSDDDRLNLAYAGSAEIGLQTNLITDRLSLGLRWASGESSGTAAFFPIVRETYGLVLTPILSGMMIMRANYQVRFLPSLAAELGGRYFIRTDTKSYSDPYLNNDSRLLGAEAAATIYWVPVSDFSLSLAGGIFFPKTGNAMASNTPLRWAMNLSSTFSF